MKRSEEIQTHKVNQKILYFEDPLSSTFEEIMSMDGLVTLRQLIDWIDTTELIINENDLQRCFTMSKMPVIFEQSITGKGKFLFIRLYEFGIC